MFRHVWVSKSKSNATLRINGRLFNYLCSTFHDSVSNNHISALKRQRREGPVIYSTTVGTVGGGGGTLDRRLLTGVTLVLS